MGIFKELFSEDWYEKLQDYLESEEFLRTSLAIVKERSTKIIYPEPSSGLLFKAFRVVPFNNVKVVILGQDPYHDGSYDGLAFSNTNKDKISPSLRNILKEANSEDPSLYRWADQGVFLLNTAHTVIKGEPESHLHYWKNFTINVIKSLNDKNDIVWLMWGKVANNYIKYIVNPTHYIISSGHPSPLNTSNPFVGCGCFNKCNDELLSKNILPIIW